MLELGLLVSLIFILLAVIASYLLKSELKKCGIAELITEKATLIAIGMPPISSAKAKFILPGPLIPGIERLSPAGKVYLAAIRAAFLLAVLSLVIGAVFEFREYA